MVTSAVAGEGKTSLSSHLAVSLARAGFRTLLIDGDLRRPRLHELFDLEDGPGLNEVLRGEAAAGDVVRPTSVAKLALVPAGAWDGGSTEALAQGGLEAVFAGLKEQYDFLVVDSSPVLPVVDSLLIGQHVDAAIFAILRDVSRAPAVYAAYERLGSCGIRVLGAVINGTREGIHGVPYQSVAAAAVD
jgi:capsular exopolysaccharide synthesis family protein